jgi:hypothetical protein
MTGLEVLAACFVTGALGMFFLSADVRNRGKPPLSLTSPIYIAGYGILAIWTVGGVWALVSGHGSPLLVFVLATWPFSLYGLYRGERSRRR